MWGKKKIVILRYWSGHIRYNVKAYLLLHTIYSLYRARLGGEKGSCSVTEERDKRNRSKGQTFLTHVASGFKAFGLSSSIEE